MKSHIRLIFFLHYNTGEGRRKRNEIHKTAEAVLSPRDFEWRALVKGINEYRNQAINEDGCVEVVNELLLKLIDAPTKKIKVITEV